MPPLKRKSSGDNQEAEVETGIYIYKILLIFKDNK